MSVISEPKRKQENYDVVVVQNCDNGFLVDCTVGDVQVSLLLDSGCDKTIISSRVYKKIGGNKHSALLQDVQCPRVELADGRQVKVHGCAVVQIWVGSAAVEHLVVIANIEGQGILGLDFLRRHKCGLAVSGSDKEKLQQPGVTDARRDADMRQVALTDECEKIAVPKMSCPDSSVFSKETEFSGVSICGHSESVFPSEELPDDSSLKNKSEKCCETVADVYQESLLLSDLSVLTKDVPVSCDNGLETELGIQIPHAREGIG